MAALFAWAINALRVLMFINLGKWVVGLLGFFGLQYVTYNFAVEPALDWIRSLMATGPSGEFGAYAMQWMGVLQMDRAVTMLLSAWVMVQTIRSAKGFLGKATA